MATPPTPRSDADEFGSASALRADGRATYESRPEQRCTDSGCATLVADVPENRCGGGVNGGPQGCGELFCGEHLFHTCQDGDLCGADYGNVEADPTPECCGDTSG